MLAKLKVVSFDKLLGFAFDIFKVIHHVFVTKTLILLFFPAGEANGGNGEQTFIPT